MFKSLRYQKHAPLACRSVSCYLLQTDIQDIELSYLGELSRNVSTLCGGWAMSNIEETRDSLRDFAQSSANGFGAILIDPPWRFMNRTGKVAPEHRRLNRYQTLSVEELESLPVGDLANPESHIYLWCPNALLADGLHLLDAWGFKYKTNLIWYKVRKDGGPDGRGVGFYFRNVTEMILFGVKGKLRTLPPGRRQTNIIVHRKREHSRKPPTLHRIIEDCSPGPFLELFARERRDGWQHWGDQVDTYEEIRPRHRGYEWNWNDMTEDMFPK